MVDILLENNEIITAHCPNSGRMTGCIGENFPVLLSISDNPKRKYKHTLELSNNGKTWIVTNTNKANELAFEAIMNNDIPELYGYDNYKREVKYGKNSRIDIFAESAKEKCYIEVKSVTMINEEGQYTFPDSPTERGRKHLIELENQKKKGNRAVMLFIILREDGEDFTPAKDIDAEYAHLLKKVSKNGVECYAYQASVSENEIQIKNSVSILF